MANTFDLISTITVGAGGASDITFNSITGSYTDLLALISIRRDNNYERRVLQVFFNGASGYNDNGLYAGPSSAFGGNLGGGANISLYDVPANLAPASVFSNVSMYISNYASTLSKTISFDSAQSWNTTIDQYHGVAGGFFNSSTAITTITFNTGQGGNWVQNSTISLYGIKNN